MNPIKEHVENINTTIQKASQIDITRLHSSDDLETQDIIKKEIHKCPESLHARLTSEFFGNGPLEELFLNKDITEIITNSPSDLWYEKGGQFKKLKDQFYSKITYDNFIQRICKEVKAEITLDHPFLCKDYNNFRVHIAAPPSTQKYFSLTIRKHNNVPWTLKMLLENNWCSLAELDFLKQLLVLKKNLFIIGPTGSGKTSLINALLQELPASERILILEDTPEIHVPNTNSVKLVTRDDPQKRLPQINLTMLLKESLRMRPERIVLGEVRGPEAKDLLLALSTGHAGSLGTLHAKNATEAIIRLEMLVQLGAPQWKLEAIRKLISLSIDYIICIGIKEGQRQLTDIKKVCGVEKFGITLDNAIHS